MRPSSSTWTVICTQMMQIQYGKHCAFSWMKNKDIKSRTFSFLKDTITSTRTTLILVYAQPLTRCNFNLICIKNSFLLTTQMEILRDCIICFKD